MRHQIRTAIALGFLVSFTLSPVASSGVIASEASAEEAPAELELDLTFDGAELAAAVEVGEDREAAGETRAAEERLEDKLIAVAESEGTDLSDADVTVVTLADGAINAALPDTMDLTSLHVTADAESGVEVEMESRQDPEASIAVTGPGMGEWGEQSDGQFVLTVRNPAIGPSNVIGTGTFLWKRLRYVNDGSTVNDWWHYSRKGIGQAAQILGDNWQVKKMSVGSYPYASAKPNMKNWAEIEPGSDFSGQCSSHSVNTNISTPVVSAGYSFNDCDQYRIAFPPNGYGNYQITMDQGNYVNEGVRSAGYSIGWKAVHGASMPMHDTQYIWFVEVPYSSDPSASCSSTDGNKTCE